MIKQVGMMGKNYKNAQRELNRIYTEMLELICSPISLTHSNKSGEKHHVPREGWNMTTLERIDEQMKKFDEYWLNHHRKRVEDAVYREAIGTLEHKVRERETYIEGLERVLNAERIKWLQHPSWAQYTPPKQPKGA